MAAIPYGRSRWPFLAVLFSVGIALLIYPRGLEAQDDGEAGTAVLLITEVLYDAAGRDENLEWVELGNLGDAPAVLDGFGLGDEEQSGGPEGLLRFPSGTVLPPGQALVIAQNGRAFRARYGFDAGFEITDSNPSVPDMLVDPAWGHGRFALADEGDEVLLLDPANWLVDALSYGDKTSYLHPSIPRVVSGQSLARDPAHCDHDRAGDWLAVQRPGPGRLQREGNCRAATATAGDSLSIGAIQGIDQVSPYLNQFVSFRGQVTGVFEDRNTAGITYYTLFVQDPPGLEDGNPATSDGLAIFTGRRRPSPLPGQIVRVRGQVTEFYGLTEIDDRGLSLTVEGMSEAALPALPLRLPESGSARASYLEAREAMLVSAPAPAAVFGPTHVGCGFAVAAYTGQARPLLHEDPDSPPAVILVQNASDVDCRDLPQVKLGDRLSQISGPLTYHFDQYKIVLQEATAVQVEAVPWPAPPSPTALAEGQFRAATLNLEDYLAPAVEGEETEERPSLVELSHKRDKLAYQISQHLACPTLLAVQEVESAALLYELARALHPLCGFSYSVSHRESADNRGIDVALLTDPRRTAVTDITLRRACTAVETDVVDPVLACPPGEMPLFSRPPLEVSLVADGRPLTVWIVHFKSKRGGAAETAARRLAQAGFVNDLAQNALQADPGARFILLGDINDADQSAAWLALQADGALVDVLQDVPEADRYSYVFDGQGQLVDGVFVSPALAAEIAAVDIAHMNADFPVGLGADFSADGRAWRASDHDAPTVVIGRPPAPSATPPPSVPAATAVQETAVATAPRLRPVIAQPLALSGTPTVTTAAPDRPAAKGRSDPGLILFGLGAALAGALVLVGVRCRRG